jgi:MFS family permease
MTAPTINWKQIMSLAALNAVVVFSWIAYNNYQPKVLVKFNFTELALFLAIAQAAIMVFIPPLAGVLGDFLIRKNTKSFIVFTTGISMTAMVFMAVAFAVGGNVFEGWRNVLPLLIVIWLVSMNVFISPANSMIEMFAPTQQLPLVMGVIVMITEMIAALEPSIVILIDALGPTITFVSGGVLIALCGYLFKTTTQNISFERPIAEAQKSSNFLLVILVGVIFGSITGIMMNIFPELLKSKITLFDSVMAGGSYYVSGILAVSALLALPLSRWAETIGVKKTLTYGLLGAVAMVLLVLATSSWLCLIACLILAIFYSMVSVSAFPFALQNLSSRQVTYGTGIFIGSTELADQLLNVILLG